VSRNMLPEDSGQVEAAKLKQHGVEEGGGNLGGKKHQENDQFLGRMPREAGADPTIVLDR